MRRVIAMVLMLAACAPGAERVVEPRPFAGDAPRGDALLRRAMLDGHNAARAAFGARPLAWNATLARDARRYAEHLARTGVFRHSDEPRGATRQGENLFTGTRGAYRYEEMIALWAAERRFYRARPVPDSSSTGRFGDVAHYTQIVWRASSEVGCATASTARDEYLVCRYTPPGNVAGQLP